MCSYVDFCVRQRDDLALKKSMLREIHQDTSKVGIGPALTSGLYLIRFDHLTRHLNSIRVDEEGYGQITIWELARVLFCLLQFTVAKSLSRRVKITIFLSVKPQVHAISWIGPALFYSCFPFSNILDN